MAVDCDWFLARKFEFNPVDPTWVASWQRFSRFSRRRLSLYSSKMSRTSCKGRGFLPWRTSDSISLSAGDRRQRKRRRRHSLETVQNKAWCMEALPSFTGNVPHWRHMWVIGRPRAMTSSSERWWERQSILIDSFTVLWNKRFPKQSKLLARVLHYLRSNLQRRPLTFKTLFLSTVTYNLFALIFSSSSLLLPCMFR